MYVDADFGLAFYKSFYPNGDWLIITLRRNYDNVRFLGSLNMRFAQVLIRCNENEIIVVAVPNNARVFNAFFGNCILD